MLKEPFFNGKKKQFGTTDTRFYHWFRGLACRFFCSRVRFLWQIIKQWPVTFSVRFDGELIKQSRRFVGMSGRTLLNRWPIAWNRLGTSQFCLNGPLI